MEKREEGMGPVARMHTFLCILVCVALLDFTRAQFAKPQYDDITLDPSVSSAGWRSVAFHAGAIPRTAPGPKLCLNVASINLPHHQLLAALHEVILFPLDTGKSQDRSVQQRGSGA